MHLSRDRGIWQGAHRRNFGLASRPQAPPQRRSIMKGLDNAIETLLFWALVIGAGSAALYVRVAYLL
jgi:hypothetical protein